MLCWLKRHKDSISSLTALIGVPLVLLGIGLTIYQLSQTKSQLEAAVIFAIQDEARDLRDELGKDQDLHGFVVGTRNIDQISDATKLRGNMYIGKILQYYSSIILQRRAGVISDDYWPLLLEDLCGAMRLERLQEALEDSADASPQAAALFEEVEQCGT